LGVIPNNLEKVMTNNAISNNNFSQILNLQNNHNIVNNNNNLNNNNLNNTILNPQQHPLLVYQQDALSALPNVVSLPHMPLPHVVPTRATSPFSSAHLPHNNPTSPYKNTHNMPRPTSPYNSHVPVIPHPPHVGLPYGHPLPQLIQPQHNNINNNNVHSNNKLALVPPRQQSSQHSQFNNNNLSNQQQHSLTSMSQYSSQTITTQTHIQQQYNNNNNSVQTMTIEQYNKTTTIQSGPQNSNEMT